MIQETEIHEHLITFLFCKGVRGFQVFVTFVFFLSFSLFQICLVSLDYALLIPRMGILQWTCISYKMKYVKVFGNFCIFRMFLVFLHLSENLFSIVTIFAHRICEFYK